VVLIQTRHQDGGGLFAEFSGEVTQAYFRGHAACFAIMGNAIAGLRILIAGIEAGTGLQILRLVANRLKHERPRRLAPIAWNAVMAAGRSTGNRTSRRMMIGVK